ncbi:hypothetical protein ZZ1p0198 [Acinetobacter phage ZZ1]|uniref:Uncharacterized protein n=1 Tax=Acinetobacter phage ZZ1 TaxID=1049283 RepID=I3WW71_9CAUD|nr:hypothetical protein ZZ1p0198 [Acinetobacter phage ZZ1]AFL47741.1 hypothetical protein ZZ1p0198 [Acinetobacter phage ZZ1]
MRTVTMKVSPTGELFYRGYQILTLLTPCACGCTSKMVTYEGHPSLNGHTTLSTNKLSTLLEAIDEAHDGKSNSTN